MFRFFDTVNKIMRAYLQIQLLYFGTEESLTFVSFAIHNVIDDDIKFLKRHSRSEFIYIPK